MGMPIARFRASGQSSRCGRGGGFGFTLGSSTLAMGSSTMIGWCAVQTVMNSLLARLMATGRGGSIITFRPGFVGRVTIGRVSVVIAFPASPGTVFSVGAAPPVGSGMVKPAFSSARAASLDAWKRRPSGSTVSPLPWVITSVSSEA